MNSRRHEILRQVVEKFVETGEAVGSRALEIPFSSATIRAEMAALETAGLLKKPHTSGGRIPTTAAYRIFVNEFLGSGTILKAAPADAEAPPPGTPAEFLLGGAVAALADATGLLAFSLAPDGKTYFLGLSKLIRMPEFSTNPEAVAGLAELLEHSPRFAALLANLPLGDRIRVWIGAEKLLPFPAETSLVAARAEAPGGAGVIGVLGPTRMDYPRALAAVKKILEIFSLARGPVLLPEPGDARALPAPKSVG